MLQTSTQEIQEEAWPAEEFDPLGIVQETEVLPY